MKIEESVPMPQSRAGRPSVYAFEKMKVGDSVFFEGESISKGCKQYIAANMYGRNHGWSFKGRTIDGGVRIWRVS